VLITFCRIPVFDLRVVCRYGWVWSILGMVVTWKNGIIRRETCPSAICIT